MSIKNYSRQEIATKFSVQWNNHPSTEDAQTSFTEFVANIIIKHIIPLPIFIRGVIIFLVRVQNLIGLIGVDNFHCKSIADRLKIQTANPVSYY